MGRSIESKLEEFNSSCKKIAINEKKELEENLENEIKSKVDAEMARYEEKLAKKKEDEEKKIINSFNSDLWNLEGNCKKELIKQNEEIKSILLESISNKMRNFVNSDEYCDFLIKTIEKAIEISGSNGIRILVTKYDKDRFFNIISKYGYISDELPDQNIGGIIVKTDNKYIDNTILNSIKEALDEL